MSIANVANVDNFDRAYTYTSTFNNFEGDPVQIKSVLLLRPGWDLITIVNRWNQAAGHTYIVNDKITIEEALQLPDLPDRISLAGILEMVGDTAEYITKEYEFKHL